MRGRVIATALLALGATAAPASAGTWAKVSSDYQSNITIPALVQDGSDTLVAWQLNTSPSTQEVDAQRFASTAAKPYTPSGPRLISFAGYSGVGNPALFSTATGVQLAVEGTRSITPGETVTGFLLAGRNPDGTFATPAVAGTPYSGDVDALALPDGTPILATNFQGAIYVLRGVVPGQLGTTPRRRSAAAAATTRRSGSTPPAGCGWPGTRTPRPTSGSTCSSSTRPAARRSGRRRRLRRARASTTTASTSPWPAPPTCRVVYGSGPASAENTIVSWAPGEASPTTIATVEVNAEPGRVVTAAYRADGKLWVAWWDGKTYRYTLGDATGKGGQVLDAGIPVFASGFSPSAYRAELAGGRQRPRAGDQLERLARGERVRRLRQPRRLRDRAAGDPGARPARRDRDDDTGRQGLPDPGAVPRPELVRQAVQGPCRDPDPHAARGASAAAPKLPGDGPVVLGTRGTVKLPAGKKVRFYMTVSKAALLKTPFHTEGGFRVAETRLRVWLKTPKGEVLTVRDGRIKVSIARITSGALPGLRGIL